MCSIDWNIIIQLFIAIGTIGAVITAIWGDSIKQCVAPIKLEIQLHNVKGLIGIKDRKIYYHLKVVNKKYWRVAKNCRVILKEIQKELPNGQFQKTPLTVDCSFFWSPAQQTPLQKDVSTEEVFDFITVSENEETVNPVLNFYPQNFEGKLEKQKKICYGLEIKADGYKSPGIQLFEVAWNGQWNENLEKMASNLTIRKL